MDHNAPISARVVQTEPRDLDYSPKFFQLLPQEPYPRLKLCASAILVLFAFIQPINFIRRQRFDATPDDGYARDARNVWKAASHRNPIVQLSIVGILLRLHSEEGYQRKAQRQRNTMDFSRKQSSSLRTQDKQKKSKKRNRKAVEKKPPIALWTAFTI